MAGRAGTLANHFRVAAGRVESARRSGERRHKPAAHRTRTQKRATEKIIEWLNEYAPYEKLAIVHAGVYEEAKMLYEQVRSFFPEGNVLIVQITPALGAHLGIGALGFACISKE